MVAGLVLDVAGVFAKASDAAAGGHSLLKNPLVVLGISPVKLNRKNAQNFLRRHLIKAASRNDSAEKFRLRASHLRHKFRSLRKAVTDNVSRVDTFVFYANVFDQESRSARIRKIIYARKYQKNRGAFWKNLLLEIFACKNSSVFKCLPFFVGTVENDNQRKLGALVVFGRPILGRKVKIILVAAKRLFVGPYAGSARFFRKIIGRVKSQIERPAGILKFYCGKKRGRRDNDKCKGNHGARNFFLHQLHFAPIAAFCQILLRGRAEHDFRFLPVLTLDFYRLSL